LGTKETGVIYTVFQLILIKLRTAWREAIIKITSISILTPHFPGLVRTGFVRRMMFVVFAHFVCTFWSSFAGEALFSYEQPNFKSALIAFLEEQSALYAFFSHHQYHKLYLSCWSSNLLHRLQDTKLDNLAD
jgi:hypothetical protein